MRLNLDASERPMGYRTYYGKPVWFLNAWTTFAEAVVARDHQRNMGRLATIVTKHRNIGMTTRIQIYYAVYTS